MATLGTHEIAGERIEIEVKHDGTFEAEYDDQDYRGATLLELKGKLEIAIRKAKATKPAEVSVVDLVPNERGGRGGWSDGAFQDGRGVVHAVLRGAHERQNQYLLTALGPKGTIKDGQKFQLSTYREGMKKIVRRLTDAEVAEYALLAGEADGAAKKLEEWIEARRVDPKQLLAPAPLKVAKA